MSILGVTKDDFVGSAWNTLVCSAPFVAGMGTAWVVNKIGRKLLCKESSKDTFLIKGYAFAVGAAVSLSIASRMPQLVPFAGKKILQFFLLTVLDVGGVIPGYFGQRSLCVIGFTGAFIGSFMDNLEQS